MPAFGDNAEGRPTSSRVEMREQAASQVSSLYLRGTRLIILIGSNKYVAGIFQDKDEAVEYLRQAPANVTATWLSRPELEFPFWLAETDEQIRFFPTTVEADAIAMLNNGLAHIVFTIAEPYRPKTPWSDEMGLLPHVHADEE